MRILRDKKGSLMIEAMVAASLVVIGLLGLFQLIVRSMQIDSSAINRFQATYLAAEGIEVVKNIIDTNVAAGNAWNGGLNGTYNDVSFDNLTNSATDTVFLDAQNSVFEGYSGIYRSGDTLTPTVFSRRIDIADVNSYELDVSSTVLWYENGSQKNVTLVDRFYDWRQ